MYRIGDLVCVNINTDDEVTECYTECGISPHYIRKHAGETFKVADVDVIHPTRIWYLLEGTGGWWLGRFLEKRGSCPFK